jgi:hypothetical protein
MKTKPFVLALSCGIGLLSAWMPEASAGKPPRQVPAPAPAPLIDPVPMPNHGYPVVVSEGGYDVAGAPCCEHKCCKRHERKCKHTCGIPVCAPSVEYRGCPTPCGITKVVTVTYPKTCMTVEVPIQVPANCCEKVDRERDGDLELDYGKYEVTLRWKDGGRRLVVHYDD